MTKLQHQTLVRQENIETAELDGEWVLLNIETHSITKLNELGGSIWSLLEQYPTIPELTDQIVAEYGVDRVMVEQDIELFVTELIGVGLLQYA
ncbi:PqqD family protein [Paenibacillus sp. MMS18-CY102]|uniref:PqqD family protein n=1 Tax=Paenibacillus sp. MMS18-CY102 TaxID=2682849 RepID=UPI001365D557|nr:PqqD family protein [Paenibacillus sp. MMS18-CY102]MWC30416.1 PqqD family peptide modification chaperone [Paenibacillus sp. MMS18-CY102]